MEEINKAIEILQAFKDGETVEYYSNAHHRWFYCDSPTVLLDKIGSGGYEQIRIKKVPQYRPYKNAEEFMAAMKEHGPFIKNADQYHNILMVDGVYGIVTHDGTARHVRCYEELLHLYTWQDGHPCGALIENS